MKNERKMGHTYDIKIVVLNSKKKEENKKKTLTWQSEYENWYAILNKKIPTDLWNRYTFR